MEEQNDTTFIPTIKQEIFGDTETDDDIQIYDCSTIKQIAISYVVVLFFWIFLIIALKLYKDIDTIEFFILTLPFLVNGITLFNLYRCNIVADQSTFRNNIIALVVLVTSILVALDAKASKLENHQDNSPQYFRIVVIGVILLMFTIVDIWGNRHFMTISTHIRTGLQTIVIALFAYALYGFFVTNYRD